MSKLMNRLFSVVRPAANADPGFMSLFDKYGLRGLDHQLRLFDYLGDDASDASDWRFSQDDGLLTVGTTAIPAGLLGSHSRTADTWLWAWANPSVSHEVAARSREVRQFGMANEIATLTRPELPIGRIVSADVLALAAVGILRRSAHLRLPIETGGAFVVVDLPESAGSPGVTPGARVLDVVDAALGVLPVRISRGAVLEFARHVGENIETAGDVELDGGRIRFDASGHVARLDRTFKRELGQPQPHGRSRQLAGTRIDQWSDSDVEGNAAWRDDRGRSPIDVLLAYLTARHAWERDSVGIVQRMRGPDDKAWAAAKDRLAAIHADLTVPRDLDELDTSVGRPAARDPKRTSVSEVRWLSPSEVAISTLEDDPVDRDMPPQKFEVVVTRWMGEWRLADRTAVYDGGPRISALL